mgnify:CR=1 FL=1
MQLEQFPDPSEFAALTRDCNVVPVCREILADMDTPVSILKKFYSRNEPSFLLESVEGGERWARYSFMGVSAHSHVKVFKDHVQILKGNDIRRIAHDNDPLEVIRDLVNAYIPADIKQLPRFWGGLTGYITYEMVSFFENIPVSLPDDTPYAHFIIPDRMIIFDNMKQTLTCVAICYLDDLTESVDPDTLYQDSVGRLDQMISTINAPHQTDEPVSNTQPVSLTSEIAPETYMAGVEKIKHHIVEGDIFQAVYSQPFSCQGNIDPLMIYRAQRYINPSPYMFFMNFKDMVIAGSSPETMVRLENHTAILRPIAGTRPRGENEQQDRHLADELLNDEKERAEHVMLIDLGRNDLGRVAQAGTVQVTDTMVIERYSHVMHLVSNIICDIKPEHDAFDLLKATFPAGTLTGAPKIRAMEIISSLEGRERRVYGGAAGYISFTGNMDLAITIRTAVMENNKLTVQAGAGIVYDSNPQKEQEECINKAKSVETALKLAVSNYSGGSHACSSN